MVDMLMHPPQSLYQIPNFLNLSQTLTHHFLPLLVQVQKSFNKLPVNKPVRFLRLALCIAEGSVSGKWNVTRSFDVLS